VLPDTVHLNQRRAEAMGFNDPISITKVQNSLRKLKNNNFRAGLLASMYIQLLFLRYAVMTKTDGKRELVLPTLTAMLKAAFTQVYIPDSWNVNPYTSVVTPQTSKLQTGCGWRPHYAPAGMMMTIAQSSSINESWILQRCRDYSSPSRRASDRKCHAAINC